MNTNRTNVAEVDAAQYMEIIAHAARDDDAAIENARAATQTMSARRWTLDDYTNCMIAARELSRDYSGVQVYVELFDGSHGTELRRYTHNTIARYHNGARIG